MTKPNSDNGQKPKLLVLSSAQNPYLHYLDELRDSVEISVGNIWSDIAKAAQSAEAVLFWDAPAPLLEQVCEHGTNVRWVHSKSAGLEPILSSALVDSDIVLTNAAGVYARSLAEFAMTGMLYFAKDLPRLMHNQSGKHWEQYDVSELGGKSLSIFGYGGIGRKTAARAKAFDMSVSAVRRNAQKLAADPLIDHAYALDGDLEAFYRTADYLVVSAPLTAETRGAIGPKQIGWLKPSAVVVNIGRGPIIDEAALMDALTKGKIRGAALDVFDVEPLPAAHKLWTLPNVLISPHSADHTDTWLDEAFQFFVENCKRWVSGEPLVNVADKLRGY